MTEIYKYDIKSTGHSSERFGPCEICKRHCTEVFYQVETKWYAYDDVDRALHQCDDLGGWTHYKCHSAFGHDDCLMRIRR